MLGIAGSELEVPEQWLLVMDVGTVGGQLKKLDYDGICVVAVLGSLATAAVWLEQGLLVLGEMVEEMTMLVPGSVATRSMGRCRCSLTMYRIEREKVQAQKELCVREREDDQISDIICKVCRGSVYRAPNLMVGASPCALDVVPLAYATAINHCARKECFEAGRTEKIHGGSKDFNLDLNFAPFGCRPRLTIAPSNGPCCKCHVLYVMGYGAAATVGIVLAQRATATAIDVACVLTAKIFPGACLFLSPVHSGQAKCGSSINNLYISGLPFYLF
ncbi:hypothetical protein DKX38_007896 [Salix brachista]|uniref:Uncharacterized protein n=1 Tax=Salix brachista TaxID=2182728 RepID=A0A5N5MPP7_9ROSI|nr:hypothetical protein DKX38_007896 [Salix brachista]